MGPVVSCNHKERLTFPLTLRPVIECRISAKTLQIVCKKVTGLQNWAQKFSRVLWETWCRMVDQTFRWASGELWRECVWERERERETSCLRYAMLPYVPIALTSGMLKSWMCWPKTCKIRPWFQYAVGWQQDRFAKNLFFPLSFFATDNKTHFWTSTEIQVLQRFQKIHELLSQDPGVLRRPKVRNKNEWRGQFAPKKSCVHWAIQGLQMQRHFQQSPGTGYENCWITVSRG